jgi:3-methyladenine DNA glycosylase Mpg
MNDLWFSAMISFVTSVEGSPEKVLTRSVFLVRGSDWEAAHHRAIDIARSMEDRYANEDGRLVSYVAAQVETLDLLGETIIDGREVYSESRRVESEDPVLAATLEISRPGQSGV